MSKIKNTVKRYLQAIHTGGWEDFIADDMTFVNGNLDTPAEGKAAYLKAAGQFFRHTTGVRVNRMIVDDTAVALLARYSVVSPHGTPGVCDVAEFLTVVDDKITSSEIFFDTAAFTRFMRGEND